MKLHNIEIANFQGLHDVKLSFEAPVTIICGNNGAGKTTLLEAIRLAIVGVPERVSKKPDYAKMITEGCKVSVIRLVSDEGEFMFNLPTGKHNTCLHDIDAEMNVALGMENFAEATPDYRRAMLFRVTKSGIKPADVAARLIRRGSPDAKVKYITTPLLSGFSEAAKFAKNKATEARGEWKGITGETYGDKKAEVWKLTERPEPVPQDELDAARLAHETAQSVHDAIQVDIGAAREKIRQVMESVSMMADFEQKASQLERLQQKLAVDEKELAAWDAKLTAIQLHKPGAAMEAELTRQLAETLEDWCLVAMRDPALAEENALLIKRSRGHLATYSNAQREGLTDSGAETTIRNARDGYSRAVSNDHRDIAVAEEAARQLAEARAAQVERPNLSGLQIELEAAKNDLKATSDTFNALMQRNEAATLATSAEDRALAAHKDVQEWNAIADALSPDGIQAEILAGALRPVNDRLFELSKVANWARVQITTDLDVQADGRPYALLSESEQWRASALLSITLALLSGTNLVLLDRFDVLDLEGRADAVDLFDSIAQQGLVQIIVAGTLKKKPEDLPNGVKANWIENHIIDDMVPVATAEASA